MNIKEAMYQRRIRVAARRSRMLRPPADMLLDAHIAQCRARGIELGVWSAEADAAFRAQRKPSPNPAVEAVA